MAQVPLAPGTVHLDSLHAVSAVCRRLDRAWHRRPEARPPRSTVELCFRGEQLLPAAGAPEDTVAVFFVQRARTRALGAMFPQHLKLLGRQFSPPFIIVGWNVHHFNLTDSIDSES